MNYSQIYIHLSLCTSSPVVFFNRIYTDPIYQSYQWGTNTTLFPSTSSSHSVLSQDYWVTATDQFGCSGTSDTITILAGNFHFDLLPSDSIFLCNAGSNVTLDAGTVGVNQQITYLWNTGATTPTINVNTPSTYYCVAMMPTAVGASADTVTVSGINPPLSYSGLSLCSGPVSLNTSNYSSYQWSNSSTTQSLSVNQAGIILFLLLILMDVQFIPIQLVSILMLSNIILFLVVQQLFVLVIQLIWMQVINSQIISGIP